MCLSILTYIGDGRVVANLFQVVVPSISARLRLPRGVWLKSVTQDQSVVDVVHGTFVEGCRAAQYRMFHPRDADVPPTKKKWILIILEGERNIKIAISSQG